jgi:hypothetical protein
VRSLKARAPVGVLRFADLGETLTALKDNESPNRFVIWQDFSQTSYHFEVLDERQRDIWVSTINARLTNFITYNQRRTPQPPPPAANPTTAAHHQLHAD